MNTVKRVSIDGGEKKLTLKRKRVTMYLTTEDFIVVTFSVLFFSAIGFFLYWTAAIAPREICSQTYSSFENKWGFYSGCQIKHDGKWIPASSYYIKEDIN